MAVLKIIVRILSYFCYVFIGIYALLCAPMIFGSRPVVVLSGSMRPTYEVGTIIYYKAVPKEEIAANDVITYKLNETMVTHRVKRVQSNGFITQGDANNVEDTKPVTYEAVQGKVGGLAIPIVGYGVQFVNEHIWIFAILVAILVAEFLLSNINSDKISVSKKGHSHDDED